MKHAGRANTATAVDGERAARDSVKACGDQIHGRAALASSAAAAVDANQAIDVTSMSWERRAVRAPLRVGAAPRASCRGGPTRTANRSQREALAKRLLLPNTKMIRKTPYVIQIHIVLYLHRTVFVSETPPRGWSHNKFTPELFTFNLNCGVALQDAFTTSLFKFNFYYAPTLHQFKALFSFTVIRWISFTMLGPLYETFETSQGSRAWLRAGHGRGAERPLIMKPARAANFWTAFWGLPSALRLFLIREPSTFRIPASSAVFYIIPLRRRHFY
ncbi:hypothetical protein C8J57DRAFT_1238140 [Mycena rebaudengoi]|nr:hypothetical protein C8J57DRAFT_1238140 [Mycena rebaudengoi]